MPWNAPKSLSTDEVYAVTAFLLNLGGIVPDNFTLSDKNIAEVQKRMPNRNGMTTEHAHVAGQGVRQVKKADTSNVACMKDCAPEPKVASFLPDFARNAHGNLAEQNRLVGPQRGADTTKPEPKGPGAGMRQLWPQQLLPRRQPSLPGQRPSRQPAVLTTRRPWPCCPSTAARPAMPWTKRLVGPSFTDIAKKHAGKADYLAGKIKSGGSGVWGPIPMPAQALSEADAKTIAAWLAAGAGK